MGTKFPKDLLVDASYLEELVWHDEPLAAAARPQVVHSRLVHSFSKLGFLGSCC